MKRPTIAPAGSFLLGLLATTLFFPPLLSAEKPDVRATIIGPARLAAGAKATLAVEMTLGTGWHVQSHTPSEKYLIPTVVTLSASAGELSPIRYPKDVEKRFSFAEKPLRIYEGTVRFETSLQLPAGASGEVSITGTLSYQACNEQQCFAPAKIPLAASFAVSAEPAAR
jgi:DsbC/DsbD-like thiol-disulfide interchange protein